MSEHKKKNNKINKQNKCIIAKYKCVMKTITIY